MRPRFRRGSQDRTTKWLIWCKRSCLEPRHASLSFETVLEIECRVNSDLHPRHGHLTRIVQDSVKSGPTSLACLLSKRRFPCLHIAHHQGGPECHQLATRYGGKEVESKWSRVFSTRIQKCNCNCQRPSCSQTDSLFERSGECHDEGLIGQRRKNVSDSVRLRVSIWVFLDRRLERLERLSAAIPGH